MRFHFNIGECIYRVSFCGYKNICSTSYTLYYYKFAVKVTVYAPYKPSKVYEPI